MAKKYNIGYYRAPDLSLAVQLERPYDSYELYATGRVYSDSRSKFLKPLIDQYGNAFVKLYDSIGGFQRLSLSRLVAEHFVPNDNPKMKNSILYIDEDKTNCSADNLKWATRTYTKRYFEQKKERNVFANYLVGYQLMYEDQFTSPEEITVVEAAETFGILYTEVLSALRTGTETITVPGLYFTPL